MGFCSNLVQCSWESNEKILLRWVIWPYPNLWFLLSYIPYIFKLTEQCHFSQRNRCPGCIAVASKVAFSVSAWWAPYWCWRRRSLWLWVPMSPVNSAETWYFWLEQKERCKELISESIALVPSSKALASLLPPSSAGLERVRSGDMVGPAWLVFAH